MVVSYLRIEDHQTGMEIQAGMWLPQSLSDLSFGNCTPTYRSLAVWETEGHGHSPVQSAEIARGLCLKRVRRMVTRLGLDPSAIG
ncbi:hypothetical protein HAX54_040620 [Datura stramonium]|uniref:Uncharacterized protein n=1 Tax=Datura stramonium TaxID=4076 RepID=A0ABS8VRH1_DATST|nr:hypothetical protein [Datura stramonium]